MLSLDFAFDPRGLLELEELWTGSLRLEMTEVHR